MATPSVTRGCGCGTPRRGIVPACNDIQRQALQAEVDQYCHGGAGSCANINDCDQLIENADTFSRCVEARRNINNLCFEGGDAGHREAARRAGQAQYNCLNRFLARCQNHAEYDVVRDFLRLHPNP